MTAAAHFSRFAVFVAVASLPASGQMTAGQIIQRAAAANERDWAAGPAFACTERDIITKNGKRTDQTFAVQTIEGTPYRRLVAVNGENLSPERAREEERKEQQAIRQRRNESRSERARRVEQYRKEREHDHLLMTEMTRAFNFRLTGESSIGGRPVYILVATPKPDYEPPNRDSRVLTGMKGTMWIDKEAYHWAKVEAEVVHPVTFGYFIAKVGPGTRFELEQSPVAGSIWQPLKFSMQVKAKILWFDRDSQEEDLYSAYRKTTP